MCCREFAVQCMVQMTDHDVASYMLEFAQLMKLETMLAESPLAAFLMYRALRNPFLVGQALYWNMRSEMHDSQLFPRFGLFLRAYLDRCGPHRTELLHQVLAAALSPARARCPRPSARLPRRRSG